MLAEVRLRMNVCWALSTHVSEVRTSSFVTYQATGSHPRSCRSVCSVNMAGASAGGSPLRAKLGHFDKIAPCPQVEQCPCVLAQLHADTLGRFPPGLHMQLQALALGRGAILSLASLPAGAPTRGAGVTVLLAAAPLMRGAAAAPLARGTASVRVGRAVEALLLAAVPLTRRAGLACLLGTAWLVGGAAAGIQGGRSHNVRPHSPGPAVSICVLQLPGPWAASVG